MKPAPDSCLPSLDLNGILAALGIAAKPSAATTAYTVVPGNDGPRWLIPNRSELAPAILREWRPYRPASRLFWSGVRLAARTGTLRLVPRTTQIDVPVDAVSRFLGYRDLAADAMPPVIMVGNRSVTRKLLVFLVSRGDNLRAVVKVPLTSLARDSIRNEAGTLEGLSGRYGAPRLIHYSEDTGGGNPGVSRRKTRIAALQAELSAHPARSGARRRNRIAQGPLRRPSRPAEPRCRARPAVPAHRLGVGLARQRQDGSGRAGSRRFRSLEHSRNGQRNAFAHRLGIRRAAGSAAARPLPFLLHAHQGVFSTRVVLCPAAGRRRVARVLPGTRSSAFPGSPSRGRIPAGNVGAKLGIGPSAIRGVLPSPTRHVLEARRETRFLRDETPRPRGLQAQCYGVQCVVSDRPGRLTGHRYRIAPRAAASP